MSKPAARNNAKIITRNQGGGDKKQGLAPLATQFFISQANNVQYRTESGDGRNRNLVMCVNQLGGVGKGRSQFRANADGKRGAGCDDGNDIYIFSGTYAGSDLSYNSGSDSYSIVGFTPTSETKLRIIWDPENEGNGYYTEYNISALSSNTFNLFDGVSKSFPSIFNGSALVHLIKNGWKNSIMIVS